jgi:hypothetical protein
MQRKALIQAVITALLVVPLGADPANAKKTSGALQTTASTIGGPMAVKVFPPSDNVAIFSEPQNVCVTLVNTGSRFVQLGLSEPSPGTSHVWLVDNGKAFATCAPAIERVTVHCDLEKGCSALVRIDRY